MARSTVSMSSSLSIGLVRKPNAPLWVAVTASGIVPCAVMMTTRRPGDFVCSSFRRPIPSILSILRSVITRSGRKRCRTWPGLCGHFRLLPHRSPRRADGCSGGAAVRGRHRPAGFCLGTRDYCGWHHGHLWRDRWTVWIMFNGVYNGTLGGTYCGSFSPGLFANRTFDRRNCFKFGFGIRQRLHAIDDSLPRFASDTLCNSCFLGRRRTSMLADS